MRKQYKRIHIEIVLNIHTLKQQYVFSGWGNEISPEKILTTFDFYIVVLYHQLFYSFKQTDKEIPIELACPQTMWIHLGMAEWYIPRWATVIWESPPQFENRIMARVYVRSIMRSTMYQKAPFCSPEMVQ